MKAAIIILASLMGHALAAPASGKCKTPAPPPTREAVCSEASDKMFAECIKPLQRDEPQDECKEKRDVAKKDCLDVFVQEDGSIIAGKDIRKKQACGVSSNRAFSKCMKARFIANSDKKTSGESLDDCNEKKKKALEVCMNDKQVEPAQAEGTKPSQEETTKPPQEEVTKPSQEEVAKPPKDETEKPPQEEVTKPTPEEVTKPTQDETEKPPQDETEKPTQEQATPNDPSESESTGQTIDDYCKVMEATSNARYDKQFCLDAFKSCGNPTSLDDAKAKDCANKIMSKEFLKPLPVDF